MTVRDLGIAKILQRLILGRKPSTIQTKENSKLNING